MTGPRPVARIEGSIFLLLLSAYAWFHPGGGWQQNARFDQVRALVETGRFSINAYIAHDRDGARHPLPAIAGAADLETDATLHTGDLSYFEGRFYPNKPPGVTLLASPGYALLLAAARAFGRSPDVAPATEILGWLTSVLSVGVLGALSGVTFFRLGRRLFPAAGTIAILGATLTMAFGTPFFPYATMLFDHVPVSALLLFAFERLVTAREEGATPGRLLAAGAAAGLAVVSNYAALLGVVLLAAYASIAIRPIARVGWALAAGLPFAGFLLAYQAVCFGGPLTIANTWQSDLFRDSSGTRFLAIFGVPEARVAFDLLVSRYRGLFPASPVLLLAFAGAFAGIRGKRRLEFAVVLALFAAYLAMNASFNAWHGGFAFGPRYLVPTIPFVALGLVPVFTRWPRMTASVAAVSIALCLAATAIDPMPPQDVRRPWRDFLMPLAKGERIERPEGSYEGRVSANLVGMGAPGREDAWNAFNVGELLFPGSALSLMPLLAIQGAGWLLVFNAGRPRA